ncbi:hypothetical protein D3C87_431610 [compost metagenome]
MKRILLHGLCPALLLLVISSCQKKETITKTSSVSENQQTKSYRNLRVWYDNGGKDYGCWLAGGNCLDDVIVTPWLADNITDFGNSTDQKAFASIHYTSLAKPIDASLLDEVIAGNLKVSLRGKITATETGYLVFKSASGNNIQSVNPFRQ